MKIKILEFQQYQGNKCKVQSHNYRKGKWKKNPNFEMYQRLAIDNPHRFPDFTEYTREVSE